ncbi:MAG: hypothetical protein QNK27_03230 [Desulfuromusa sp.]|nr:hypothetical protein [Desulfuromusa sp.]
MTGCTKKVQQATVPGEEWAEDLRSRVERHIDEPEKKRQLMNLVDQDADILKTMSQQTERYNKELFAVDRNYNSTPEDFRKVFSEFNATRNRLRADSLDVRFKMKALCSPEEWKALSYVRVKDSLYNQMFPKPSIE